MMGIAPMTKGTTNMALSDQLSNLATRTKELEDRAASAKQKQKTDLQNDVKNARESAQAQADSLREAAKARKGDLSAQWDTVQRSWSEHVDAVRTSIDERRAAHDLKHAQKAADRADDDAAFAIDYASAVIEEAEYAVLDAELAHMEADELAQS
jgi:hypothetical protein